MNKKDYQAPDATAISVDSEGMLAASGSDTSPWILIIPISPQRMNASLHGIAITGNRTTGYIKRGCACWHTLSLWG